ncbi:7-methylguanosine phosphate-specific 5'-nucleotidase isoform X1 [Amia ocellicauda]|uniref:7-methylguanosine phosphate-specific 5'-nucleotidase isoform X1 n=1 Tax=Amia ocellicauda TaxID=2972642 RepID=UPI003463B964
MHKKRPSSDGDSGSVKRACKEIAVDVPELAKSTVRIQDRKRVQEILQSIHNGGPSKLQVIADFDMTLTKFAHNGKRCPTCHNIMENSTVISEECKKQLQGLLDKYYPIEIDPKRTIEEKTPEMVKWWNEAHDLLISQKIQKDKLVLTVRESDARLRDGYRVFFDELKKQSIPLLIFSAGIGDVLEEVIRQAGVFHPNVKVFSNYMDFDESGILQAFKGQLIHTYNKREGALLNSDHFQELKNKRNIILLGDSMGDLTMADGVHSMENILKIGYLNDKVEEREAQYMDAYDIVLEKDETMDVVNGILKYITAKN